MNPAEILAGYAAEVVEGHRQRRQPECPSCGSENFLILTRHPSEAWLVECEDCHDRWLEENV
jgi:ribosomal protein L37AE/L43A